MSKIIVWTKQNKAILKELEETGRHICKKEYIGMDLQEHIHLVLEVYDWLVKHTTNREYNPRTQSIRSGYPHPKRRPCCRTISV